MKTGGVPGCKNQNRWSPRVYKSKHVESQSVQIKTGGVPGCTTMRNSEIKNNPRSPQTTSSYMMMYIVEEVVCSFYYVQLYGRPRD